MVYALEESREEKKFSFEALQNIVVLSAKLGKLDNMVARTRILLKLINTLNVSRNEVNDAVNQILDAVGDI
jgi:hypothetical protein